MERVAGGKDRRPVGDHSRRVVPRRCAGRPRCRPPAPGMGRLCSGGGPGSGSRRRRPGHRLGVGVRCATTPGQASSPSRARSSAHSASNSARTYASNTSATIAPCAAANRARTCTVSSCETWRCGQRGAGRASGGRRRHRRDAPNAGIRRTPHRCRSPRGQPARRPRHRAVRSPHTGLACTWPTPACRHANPTGRQRLPTSRQLGEQPGMRTAIVGIRQARRHLRPPPPYIPILAVGSASAMTATDAASNARMARSISPNRPADPRPVEPVQAYRQRDRSDRTHDRHHDQGVYRSERVRRVGSLARLSPVGAVWDVDRAGARERSLRDPRALGGYCSRQQVVGCSHARSSRIRGWRRVIPPMFTDPRRRGFGRPRPRFFDCGGGCRRRRWRLATWPNARRIGDL